MGEIFVMMFVCCPEFLDRIGLDSVLRFGILSVGLEVIHLVLLQSIGLGKMVLTLCLWLREEVSQDSVFMLLFSLHFGVTVNEFLIVVV